MVNSFIFGRDRSHYVSCNISYDSVKLLVTGSLGHFVSALNAKIQINSKK